VDLQREDGRAVADMAVSNLRLDRNHRHAAAWGVGCL
jgi:hypothetical protein